MLTFLQGNCMNHYTKYIKTLTLSLFILTGCRDYNQFDGDKYAPVGDETDGTGGSYTWLNPTTPKEKFSFRTDWDNTAAASTTKIQHYALFYYKDADNWKLFHELTSTLDDYNYGKTAPIDLGALKTIVDNPAFNSSSKVNNYENPTTLKIFDITFKTDRKMNSTTINRRFRSTGLTSEYDLYIVEGYPTSLPSTTTYLRAHYNFSEIFDKYKTFVPSDLTFFVTAPSLIPPDPYKDEIFKTRLENITATPTTAKYRNSLDDSSGFTPFTHGSTTPPDYLPDGIKTIIKSATAPKFNSISANKVSIDLIATDLTHTIPATTDYGTPSKDFDYTIDNGTFFLVITDSPLIPTKTLIQYKYTVSAYDDTDGIYKQYIPRDIYVNIASDERSDTEKFKDNVKGEYVYETRDVDGTPQPMNPLGQFDAKGDNFIPYSILSDGTISPATPVSFTSPPTSDKIATYGTYTFNIEANTVKIGSSTKKIILTSTIKRPLELWTNIRTKYKYIYDSSDKPLGYLDNEKLMSAYGNFKITYFNDKLVFKHENSDKKSATITITSFPPTSPMGKLEVDTPSSSISITLKDATPPIPPIPLSDGLLQQGTTTIGTLSGGNKYNDGAEYTLEHSWVTGTTYTYVYTSGTSIRTIVKNGTSYKLYQEFASAIDVTFVDPLKKLIAKLDGFVYSTGTTWEKFPDIITPVTGESGVIGKYTVKRGDPSSDVTYTIKDINISTWAVTLTDGTIHTLIVASGQYGVATSGTIPFGTEIALKPSTGDEIKAYTDQLKLQNLIFPYENRVWEDLTITDNSIEWWRAPLGEPYKIIRVNSPVSVNSKILVSSKALGQEVHQFKDSAYFNYRPNGTTKRDDLAFVKITDVQREAFVSKVNKLKLVYKGTSDPFEITYIDGYENYNYDSKSGSKTYKIGLYIDDKTIYVAKKPGTERNGMEKHGLIDGKYGIITSDSTIDIIAEKDTRVDKLKAELAGFVYAKDGEWVNFPKSITPVTGEAGIIGEYTVAGVDYNITDIDISSWNVNVKKKGTEISEIHKIIGDQYGVSTGSGGVPISIPFGTEIAIIKADSGKIREFHTKTKEFVYNSGKKYDSIWVDTSTGKYQSAGENKIFTDTNFTVTNYSIGRFDPSDPKRVLVAKSPKGTEIHEITGSGKMEELTVSDSRALIALKPASEADIIEFGKRLKNFVYADNKGWLPVVVDATARTIVARERSVFYIERFDPTNPNKVIGVESWGPPSNKTGYPRTWELDSTEKKLIRKIPPSDTSSEIILIVAFIESTRDEIEDYAEKVNDAGLVYSSGINEGKPFKISKDGSYDDHFIGLINPDGDNSNEVFIRYGAYITEKHYLTPDKKKYMGEGKKEGEDTIIAEKK